MNVTAIIEIEIGNRKDFQENKSLVSHLLSQNKPLNLQYYECYELDVAGDTW